jgi:hypothetical protein
MSLGLSVSTRTVSGALIALAVLLGVAVTTAAAAPVPTTRKDFEMPGTQPLSITDDFSTPDDCSVCHADYGAPEIEPFRNWAGSMMGQTGRDPVWFAAMVIANQDAAHSGDLCLRCHLPKGWLEGRSTPEDGSAMTADDREGVQCTVCHRMVDPFADPENPTEDTAILAALTAPVTRLGSAQFVMDPLERLRGPFDVVADLGSDPHAPTRSTLVSPFHASSEQCGVCHNVFNPVFTYNAMTDAYEPGPLDTPGDPSLGFPEQQTYDEWALSEFASGTVFLPRFGKNKPDVSSCQDCHMPDVSGKAAAGGIDRDDMPSHELLGSNTFVPDIIPHHPVFGADLSAPVIEALSETVGKNTQFQRKAATVTADLSGAALTVRVTNETGHKLPTGYPEGRRMWLHVRAYDADGAVVFESGRYDLPTATLVGHHALVSDPDYDPNLHVWEAIQGLSPSWAAALGMAPGPSPHLALNNARLYDNRIPPRGFVNAVFEAVDAEPVGQAYADGEYWDDVEYPVGASAVQAEVVLYFQTTAREYVEFLRDENVTNGEGLVLYDLWNDHGQSAPVEMSRLFVETDASVVAKCHKSVSKLEGKFLKKHLKEWGKCYFAEAKGVGCDATRREEKIATAQAKMSERLGGIKDKKCGGVNLTPNTLGHAPVCPQSCADSVLFDFRDLDDCGVCTVEALGGAVFDAAYGVLPPDLPAAVPSDARSCQKALEKSASLLANGWVKALYACGNANKADPNGPQLDCSTDPDGSIAKAMAKAAKKLTGCKDDFTGLGGCAAAGSTAAVQACIEAGVGVEIAGVEEVAFP